MFNDVDMHPYFYDGYPLLDDFDPRAEEPLKNELTFEQVTAYVDKLGREELEKLREQIKQLLAEPRGIEITHPKREGWITPLGSSGIQIPNCALPKPAGRFGRVAKIEGEREGGDTEEEYQKLVHSVSCGDKVRQTRFKVVESLEDIGVKRHTARVVENSLARIPNYGGVYVPPKQLSACLTEPAQIIVAPVGKKGEEGRFYEDYLVQCMRENHLDKEKNRSDIEILWKEIYTEVTKRKIACALAIALKHKRARVVFGALGASEKHAEAVAQQFHLLLHQEPFCNRFEKIVFCIQDEGVRRAFKKQAWTEAAPVQPLISFVDASPPQPLQLSPPLAPQTKDKLERLKDLETLKGLLKDTDLTYVCPGKVEELFKKLPEDVRNQVYGAIYEVVRPVTHDAEWGRNQFLTTQCSNKQRAEAVQLVIERCES
jgi:hypothetical protein